MMLPRRAWAAIAAAAVLGAVVTTALARIVVPGTLDGQFGDAGKTDDSFAAGGGFDVANDVVAVGSLGKLVAVGFTQPDETADFDFALAGYEPEGDRDTDFGGDGQQTTDFNGGNDIAEAVALAPDGKLVVAGQADPAPMSDDEELIAVARYKRNGKLDPSFSGDGLTTVKMKNSESSRGHDVVVSDNGRITVAGESRPAGGGTPRFAVARLNPDGSRDNSFSGDGRVTTAFPGGDFDQAQAIVADGGKVIVAGHSFQAATDDDYALARYKKNGSLDPAWGGDGLVTTDIQDSDRAFALAIQQDGSVIAAGESTGGQSDYSIARYLTDGDPDDSFDDDGVATESFTDTFNERINDLAVQANGKILAAGATGDPDGDFSLLRFLSGGGLDPGFSPDAPAGAVFTDFVGTTDRAEAITLAPFTPPNKRKRGDPQPQVRAVLAGSSEQPAFAGVDFALARYLVHD